MMWTNWAAKRLMFVAFVTFTPPLADWALVGTPPLSTGSLIGAASLLAVSTFIAVCWRPR